jgi:hypothetical protein
MFLAVVGVSQAAAAEAPSSDRPTVGGDIGYAEGGYWLGLVGGGAVGALAGAGAGSFVPVDDQGEKAFALGALGGVAIGAAVGGVLGAPALVSYETGTSYGWVLLGSVAGTVPGAVVGTALIAGNSRVHCTRAMRPKPCAGGSKQWGGATLLAVWSNVGSVGGSVAAAELAGPTDEPRKPSAVSLAPTLTLGPAGRPYLGVGGAF